MYNYNFKYKYKFNYFNIFKIKFVINKLIAK